MVARALGAALLAACVSGCAHQSAPVQRQVPLGTRASPFAHYITVTHRQIHKKFTLGFLADIDARNDPTYADHALWTQLEIVINADGKVDRIGVRRKSGVGPFDAAAVDSVLSASPFPPPPEEIKSADGNVHLDWQFHRDERACGPFGVDPHILEPDGADARPRESSDMTAARDAAEGWLAAYVRGDPAWLSGWSATPFTSSGGVIARDAPQLKKFYADLVAGLTGPRHLDRLRVLTPAELRDQRGAPPPGGERSGMLYAAARVDGNELILELARSNQGWRVCGLDR